MQRKPEKRVRGNILPPAIRLVTPRTICSISVSTMATEMSVMYGKTFAACGYELEVFMV